MRFVHALRSLAVLASLVMFAFMPVSAATLNTLDTQTQDYQHTAPVVANCDLIECDRSGGGDATGVATIATSSPLIGSGGNSILPGYVVEPLSHYENPIGKPLVPIDKRFRL